MKVDELIVRLSTCSMIETLNNESLVIVDTRGLGMRGVKEVTTDPDYPGYVVVVLSDK